MYKLGNILTRIGLIIASLVVILGFMVTAIVIFIINSQIPPFPQRDQVQIEQNYSNALAQVALIEKFAANSSFQSGLPESITALKADIIPPKDSSYKSIQAEGERLADAAQKMLDLQYRLISKIRDTSDRISREILAFNNSVSDKPGAHSTSNIRSDSKPFVYTADFLKQGTAQTYILALNDIGDKFHVVSSEATKPENKKDLDDASKNARELAFLIKSQVDLFELLLGTSTPSSPEVPTNKREKLAYQLNSWSSMAEQIVKDGWIIDKLIADLQQDNAKQLDKIDEFNRVKTGYRLNEIYAGIGLFLILIVAFFIAGFSELLRGVIDSASLLAFMANYYKKEE